MDEKIGSECLRCGTPIAPGNRGRPRLWCSQRCRRAAYEARRAARENEHPIEVKIVRVPPNEVTLADHIAAVLDSPVGIITVMREASRKYHAGELNDLRWGTVWDYLTTTAHEDLPTERAYAIGPYNRVSFHPERLNPPQNHH